MGCPGSRASSTADDRLAPAPTASQRQGTRWSNTTPTGDDRGGTRRQRRLSENPVAPWRGDLILLIHLVRVGALPAAA